MLKHLPCKSNHFIFFLLLLLLVFSFLVLSLILLYISSLLFLFLPIQAFVASFFHSLKLSYSAPYVTFMLYQLINWIITYTQ